MIFNFMALSRGWVPLDHLPIPDDDPVAVLRLPQRHLPDWREPPHGAMVEISAVLMGNIGSINHPATLYPQWRKLVSYFTQWWCGVQGWLSSARCRIGPTGNMKIYFRNIRSGLVLHGLRRPKRQRSGGIIVRWWVESNRQGRIITAGKATNISEKTVRIDAVRYITAFFGGVIK